uniref:Homeobox domain-containing protein n=1 Tax=Biomphalaria glabrata TaxID=6526 RepID=A0A2C9LJF9_BIOGL
MKMLFIIAKTKTHKKCQKYTHHLVNVAKQKNSKSKVNKSIFLNRRLKLLANRRLTRRQLRETLTPATTSDTTPQYTPACPISETDKLSIAAVGPHPSAIPNVDRTPSVSPVPIVHHSGSDPTTPPKEPADHRFSPGWHKSFSISAILARASSTPRKDSSLIQSSSGSSQITSPECGSTTSTTSTTMSTECVELNKENQARCSHDFGIARTAMTEPAAASGGHCQECEHLNNSRRKMERTKFSKEDIQVLTDYFRKDRYPSSLEIEQLAKQLGYRVVKIKTWFQNKRASVSGTRQPKSQNPALNYSSNPLAGHHAVLVPMVKSLMENISYGSGLLTRHQPPPAVNLVAAYPPYNAATIDSNFAPSASHYLPSPHGGGILPSAYMSHYSPVHPYHYLGNGFL